MLGLRNELMKIIDENYGEIIDEKVVKFKVFLSWNKVTIWEIIKNPF